jgi:hypothetical protein
MEGVMRVKALAATAAVVVLGASALAGVATARGGHAGGFHGGGHATAHMGGVVHAQVAGGGRVAPMGTSRFGQNRFSSLPAIANRFEGRSMDRHGFAGNRFDSGRDDRDHVDRASFERDHVRHFDRFRRFGDDGFGVVAFGFGYDRGEYDDAYGAYPTDDYAANDYPPADAGYGDEGDRGRQDYDDQRAGGGYYDAQPHNEAYYYRHVGGGRLGESRRSSRHHAAGRHCRQVRRCPCANR